LSSAAGEPSTAQLGLFAAPAESTVRSADALRGRLDAIDVDETTPRQALELLAELKRLSTDS
jgi:hypothetical protein